MLAHVLLMLIQLAIWGSLSSEVGIYSNKVYIYQIHCTLVSFLPMHSPSLHPRLAVFWPLHHTLLNFDWFSVTLF